jgi:hypothetical protein
MKTSCINGCYHGCIPVKSMGLRKVRPIGLCTSLLLLDISRVGAFAEVGACRR